MSDKSLDNLGETALISFVRELNAMAYDATEAEGFSFAPFRYVSDGNLQVIECFNHQIWNSDDNGWDSEETLREHIVGEICAFLDSLVKLGDIRRALTRRIPEKMYITVAAEEEAPAISKMDENESL